MSTKLVSKFIRKTDRSLIEFKDSLEHYDVKGTEVKYKGKIPVTIVEYQLEKETKQVTSSKNATAYLDKATAKLVMQSIIDDSFSSSLCYKERNATTKLFENKPGLKEFKGSNGESRVLSVSYDETKLQYQWSIQIGPGKATANGAVMPDGPPTVKVYAVVDKMDMKKIALDILDYIRHKELLAMQQGKPLNDMASLQERSEKPA